MCLLHLLRLVLKSVTIPYIPHGQQETANDRNASQDSLSEKWEWVHAQLWLSLCDPMDCSPPGSSVHGISQASIRDWVVISFSRGSSCGLSFPSPGESSSPRDLTQVSCVAGKFLPLSHQGSLWKNEIIVKGLLHPFLSILPPRSWSISYWFPVLIILTFSSVASFVFHHHRNPFCLKNHL